MISPNSVPSCSIIIVSYNVASLLLDCLQSVYSSAAQGEPPLSIEVIVVDSASTDDTVAQVRAMFPQVTLITSSENIGFTRGNNIGLKAARGEFLFLLNPDTVLLADALPELVRYLHDQPDIGIVGPHTYNSDLTTQSTRRRFPTRLTAFFESTWLQGLAPHSILNHFYVNDIPDNISHKVEWVQGSALMMRRQVYHDIGGLDESYHMYSEELDFCKRAYDVGWRIGYHADAHIIHHGGASSDQIGAMKHIHFQTSKVRYHHKAHGRSFAMLLRTFLIASYMWQIAQEGVKAMLGNKRPMRLERVRTYWQVVRSGLSQSV